MHQITIATLRAAKCVPGILHPEFGHLRGHDEAICCGVLLGWTQRLCSQSHSVKQIVIMRRSICVSTNLDHGWVLDHCWGAMLDSMSDAVGELLE